jgi:hypothetical protein
MNKEYKIIHASVFDPSRALFRSSKKDPSTCTLVKCNNSENCGLYSRGECTYISMFPNRCPYGNRSTEIGPTMRSKKCYGWVSERKGIYSEYFGKLKDAGYVIAKIGDYIYLPYSHITMNKSVPFLEHSNFFVSGNPFLPVEHFDLGTVKSICNFTPQAMMGGEITRYQKESVPMFIKHWGESGLMPELYMEFMGLDSRVKEIEQSSNVGRKAILQTLNPNIGVFNDGKKETWAWDGTYLTSSNCDSDVFMIVKASEIRIKPKENSVVVVTDDRQVNKNTKFTS